MCTDSTNREGPGRPAAPEKTAENGEGEREAAADRIREPRGRWLCSGINNVGDTLIIATPGLGVYRLDLSPLNWHVTMTAYPGESLLGQLKARTSHLLHAQRAGSRVNTSIPSSSACFLHFLYFLPKFHQLFFQKTPTPPMPGTPRLNL